MITFSPFDTSRNLLYDLLEWMTVKQLIFYHTTLAVYRIRESGEPSEIATLFKRENRNQNVIIPQSNMELYRKAFIYRAIQSWNSVPKEIRSLKTLISFKKNLKTWVMREVERFP